MEKNFVHLHLHTEYSLLDGVGKIEDYLTKAKEYNMKSIAITDHGNLFGAIEFYQKSYKFGIKPIIGLEAYVTEDISEKSNKTFHMTLLAKNIEGYKNLLKLTSISYVKGFYRRPRVDKNLLKKYSEGLIALSGCIHGEIPTTILENEINKNKEKDLSKNIEKNIDENIESNKNISVPEIRVDKISEDKTEEIKTEETNKEEIKTEKTKTEETNKEEIKTEKIKTEEIKTEKIKDNEYKVGKNVENTGEDYKIIKVINDYIEIFGKENFYLEVQGNGIASQNLVNEKLFELGEKLKIDLVATNDVHYLNKGDDLLQDIVICIQTGAKISDKKRMKIETKELYFKSKDEMLESLGNKYRLAIENSNKIADLCNLQIEFGKIQFPKCDIPEGYSTSYEYLKKLVYEGLEKKYSLGLSEEVVLRAEHELSIISQMNYEDYFIVVWDFIDFARKNDIIIGPGRGSAAGSLVAYALGITQVDPLKYNLIFERFLNPERISLPDIDTDICQERRQEVIDYVVKKYGEDKVAQIITFGTMKARAAIRDVGRVLDIKLAKIDKVAKLLSPFSSISDSMSSKKELSEIYKRDNEIKTVVDIAMRLENKVRHPSTHAAGIVVTREKLVETTPLYLDNKNNVVTTQFQMKELEELGLVKIDFLGLANLSVLQRTLTSIKNEKNLDIKLEKLPLDDKEVFALLSEGDTTGIFQMESFGMRKILRKMKINSFEDIIAILSLYRPGPLSSGMVDDFIARKNGKGKIIYPHPNLEPILKETYGVIIYQEQVMKIANVMANYTLGEADILRRAMGKKISYIMEENREKFLVRALKNGYDKRIANDIFELIVKFASYGFNKSHSAAYALITYWTAYFKVHFPKNYYSSLMNSEISNIDKLAFYIEDAKRNDIYIESPDVNNPTATFEVYGDKILFSLSAIKNVGETFILALTKEYNESGKYLDYENFVKRTKKIGLNKKSLESLIFAGALDSLPGNRNQKFLTIDKIMDYTTKLQKDDEIQQMNLFGEWKQILDKFSFPNFSEFPLEEILQKEKEYLGFYLSAHPIDSFKNIIIALQLRSVLELKTEEKQGKILTYGIIKDIKKTNTKTNQMMAFFSLEGYNSTIPAILFPNDYMNCFHKLNEGDIVFIEGTLKKDYFRDIETKKIIVNNISNVFEIIDKIKTIYILILEEDREKYSELKNIIKKYKKGNTSLSFVMKKDNKKVIKDSKLTVQLDITFINEIIELMGSQKIRMKL